MAEPVRLNPVRQFGPTRHTRDLGRTETPSGLDCAMGCGREIADDDEGFVLADEAVVHRACLLENILGPSWREQTED
jgi:hypothetical protein